MKVIATATGWDGKRVRNTGDVFDMPDKSKAPWFEPYKGKEPATDAASEEFAGADKAATDLV